MTELMQYRTARTRTELRNGRNAQSENATPGNRPVQTITYDMPAASFTQGALGQLSSIKSLGVLAQ